MTALKISVIMGVHNGAKTLERAVDSIVNQTYDNWELIICDDCSTDNSYEIMQKISAKHPEKVIILRNSQNMGLAYSLNRCLDSATGDYIARMDDDDICRNDRFEKQVCFLESHPEYAVAGTLIQRFDEEGYWGTPGKGHEVSVKDIFQLRAFTHPSVMMRKTALTKVGGYTVSPLTMRSQDFDLWCKLYCNGFVGFNMDEILLDYYEKRNATKEVVFKYKYSLYKMMKYWRKKMRLPISYNYYAYRVLIKLLVPRFVLVLYKNNK